MGGRELHQLREGHQLAVVRGLRCGLQQRQQLAVDAVRREGHGQPHLHRDQVHHPRLLPVPGQRSQLQGDLLAALLRVRRGDPRTASLGTGELQTHW